MDRRLTKSLNDLASLVHDRDSIAPGPLAESQPGFFLPESSLIELYEKEEQLNKNYIELLEILEHFYEQLSHSIIDLISTTPKAGPLVDQLLLRKANLEKAYRLIREGYSHHTSQPTP